MVDEQESDEMDGESKDQWFCSMNVEQEKDRLCM